MVNEVLAWLGATDKALILMGPTATILLSWVFGGAAAQFLKFPLSQWVGQPWFDWLVRLVAVTATFGFAHILSGNIAGPLEAGAALSQPCAYWLSLRVIRRFWPWMEISPLVGAITPPLRALEAAAEREERNA